MRIGTSHYSLSYSNSIVEHNYFDRCDGEHEIELFWHLAEGCAASLIDDVVVIRTGGAVVMLSMEGMLLVVELVEGLGELEGNIEGLFEGGAMVAEVLVEGLAVEVGEDEGEVGVAAHQVISSRPPRFQARDFLYSFFDEDPANDGEIRYHCPEDNCDLVP